VAEREFVPRDIYELQIAQLVKAIEAIEENLKWMTRLVITQLVGLVIGILIFLVNNAQV
jgi:hypothetical protein